MSRERLEELRARKRMAELQAKRDGVAPTQNPSESTVEPIKLQDEVGAGGVADAIGSGLQGISDFVRQVPQKIPLISPLAQSAAAGVESLVTDKSYDQAMQGIQNTVAERDERSPIAGVASDVAGVFAAPGSAVAGLPGVVTSLGVSAADQLAKRDLTGQNISDGDLAGNLGFEAGAGALGMGAGKVIGKLADSDMYRSLAQKYGKQALGGTKGQLEKLDIKSDALDNSVNRLLDENVFNKPIMSKEELYEGILARRQESGKTAQDIFANSARPANQAESYDQLIQASKDARNKGQKELADKLQAEANVLRDIDSTPISGPTVNNQGFSKADEMSVTELDPNIIKGRKTQLDEQAYGNKLQTDKTAERAAGEVRDMQYGLMDDPSALRTENKRYGELKTAEDLASRAAAGEVSNGGGLIQATKRGIGSGIGALSGSAAGPLGTAGGAILGAAAQGLITNYGNQLGAYGFNKASKVLQNNKWAETLKSAADRGGAAGVGTAHFLLTQRDPEYRKTFQEDQEAGKDQ